MSAGYFSLFVYTTNIGIVNSSQITQFWSLVNSNTSLP